MKTMQDFADRQLTKRQMNEVKGGAKCADGTNKYICGVDFGGGYGGGGIVCTSSLQKARELVFEVYWGVITSVGDGKVRCVETL